jgi:chromosome segregation protein
MIFKSLIVQGFKSFADRTEFHFDDGITGVVGPNGCGKSNVLDAVKWVLGEQSAKSLRGSQMLDVIFSGSGTRKPAGMAEAELVFDNTSGRLAIDQTEVAVTRRLYRSGESEYLLNKQPSRLRDIRELFLDTGIGSDAYSFIEQGKVDALLQANPQERRTIFEQAAGVAKYKARRKEAERKLERVEQNLLRVEDIIEEVESRLRSVKLQAGKARSYQEHAARLSELRASYSLAEYHRLAEEHAAVSRAASEAEDRQAEVRAAISQSETETSELDTRLLELNETISRLDDHHLRIQAEVRADEERVAQSRGRAGEQQQVLARCRERLVAERRRAAEVRMRREQLEQQVTELTEQISAKQTAIQEASVVEQAEARRLAELQAELDDEKSGLIDLLRRSSQLSNEIQGLDTHQENLRGEKGRLSQRDARISEELESLLVRKAESEGRQREVEALIAEQNRRLEEKRRQAAQVVAERDSASKELALNKEQRSALQSQMRVLDEVTRKLEGVEAGVREVIRRRDTDETGRAYDYVAGMVGQLIETDSEYASVIEASLGEMDQYLVVTDRRRFFAEADAFGELAGRVNVICLDLLPPFVASPDLSQETGVVARAMDLVRPSALVGGELLVDGERLVRDDFNRLLKHLLDRTVVVESLDVARRLRGTQPGGHRFITRDGQVLEVDGRVSVGPTGTRAGLVARQSQVHDLARQLEQIEQQIAEWDDRRNRLSAEAAHLEQLQKELRDSIYDANAARVECASRIENLAEGVSRLTREQPMIVGQITTIEQAIAEAVERADRNKDTLSEVRRQNTEREARVEQLHGQVDAVVTRRTAIRDQVTELRVELGQITEKHAAVVQTVGELGLEAVDAERAAGRAADEARECAERIDQAERAILTTQSQLAELYLSKERVRADGLEQRRAREQTLHRREQLAGRIKELRDELEEVESGLHQLQMRLGETNVRREELVSRVLDELQIDLPEQYARGFETDEEQGADHWEAVEEEIAELRGKIDRLGNVNLDAIAEQEELEERLGFLTTQCEDLTESRQQLEQLIGKLNRESRDRFITSFTQIREQFQELYRRLFGGGKADILLEDEEDVLECGIEIVARPPGKELQRLTLLSGGEKSMTAIALLLAIFSTRPSPFAILDEVDAALDEANNERFNRIIQDFMTKSQFIVVTHSKRTMSITNRLYGVTMQEAGVSKLVSVRFDEATSAA